MDIFTLRYTYELGKYQEIHESIQHQFEQDVEHEEFEAASAHDGRGDHSLVFTVHLPLSKAASSPLIISIYGILRLVRLEIVNDIYASFCVV